MRWPASLALLSLVACGGVELPFGEEEPKQPEPKPIEAPPEALDLYVSNATVNIISVKNGDTEVPGKFDGVSGSLSFEDGKNLQGLAGSLTFDLSSWDSGLEERDKNIEQIFFKVADEPTATFTLDSVEGLPAEGIPVGHDAQGTATGTLYLAGANMGVTAKIKVSRSAEQAFHIDTVEPFIVSVEKLHMTERLKSLMTACKHESIDDSVRVSVRMDLTTDKPAGAAPTARFGPRKPGTRHPAVRAKVKKKAESTAPKTQTVGPQKKSD